ncbi:MAG: histidine kinase [Proteobacteria bacterium]|uniref:sensor histidine kinase n=1 Tax=Rudaea sp. TaxID=2136325 RepID=UPI00322078D6|nr:histidine kinase [Pseudomonadota bacterium]
MSEGATKPMPAAAPWLPDFCSLPVLLATMLVVELLVVAILLAPSDETMPLLPRLGTATVFAQWLALVCIVCLCQARPVLFRLAPFAGVLAAYAIILAIVAIGSAVVFTLDQQLGASLTLAPRFGARFVLRNTALAALVGAALLRYFYVIEQWRARVQAEARARLDALQARIRPHFLFNSMNTIASLIRTEPVAAERAVEDLSDLFRAALGADGKPSTLGAELELAQRYLAIERLRLGERLRVDIDLAADLPHDLPLPALLLQPLVENAIHHGIQPLAQGGAVTLRARRDGGGAVVAIGNPRPREGLRAPTRNGMALANTRARIEHHFGRRAEFEVHEGALDFEVVLRLPGA